VQEATYDPFQYLDAWGNMWWIGGHLKGIQKLLGLEYPSQKVLNVFRFPALKPFSKPAK